MKFFSPDRRRAASSGSSWKEKRCCRRTGSTLIQETSCRLEADAQRSLHIAWLVLDDADGAERGVCARLHRGVGSAGGSHQARLIVDDVVEYVAHVDIERCLPLAIDGKSALERH